MSRTTYSHQFGNVMLVIPNVVTTYCVISTLDKDAAAPSLVAPEISTEDMLLPRTYPGSKARLRGLDPVCGEDRTDSYYPQVERTETILAHNERYYLVNIVRSNT